MPKFNHLIFSFLEEPTTLKQNKRMWLKYGNGNPDADMPLILDDDCA